MHKFMHPNWQQFIHTVDAGSEGGSANPDPDNNSANPDPDNNSDTDLQAKYENAIKHSREWEKRAKANKNAVEELEKLKTQQEQLEQRAAQADKLQAQIDEMKATLEMRVLKNKISEETRIPADLIPDGSEKAMRAYVDKFTAWQKSQPKLPTSDQSTTPKHSQKDADMRSMLSSLFGTNN